MRIGITCYPTYGGSGVVATELGIELATLGHEVHFISYSQPFRLTGRDEGIYYHEVPVASYPLFEFPPYDLALASRMLEVAEFCKLDLLHVHYAIPHSVSALLARQMAESEGKKLPFVTTLHGTDITLVGLDRGYLPITRYALEQSDGITAISDYLKRETACCFGVKNEIEVVPNFVNCNVYRPFADEQRRKEGRQRLIGCSDVPLLMHLSNFRPVKRVVDVIRTFAQVAAESAAHLVLVGDGPERSEAEWLAHELKIHTRTHFVGKLDRVNELLPLADMMLMPSQLESFGLAALEAMACQVVPVATRVGGVPELIDHQQNGLLYEVGDVNAMAQGIIELLASPAKFKAMGQAARHVAQTRFCSSLVVPRYVEYYERVLERQ